MIKGRQRVEENDFGSCPASKVKGKPKVQGRSQGLRGKLERPELPAGTCVLCAGSYQSFPRSWSHIPII